jgi:hypothetical protein
MYDADVDVTHQGLPSILHAKACNRYGMLTHGYIDTSWPQQRVWLNICRSSSVIHTPP